ncbi:MAG: D-alanyl-D-alanine carboxypeptidase family protein [Alphaproteobacteria bacterium]
MTVFAVFAAAGPAPAAAKENRRYASIVLDADTGMVLSQSNADKRLHPASLTKVMTLLMLFEAMEQGRLSPRDRIRISKHAAGMVPSKLGLSAGSSIRVQDAIYAVVTKSANDVAVAIAEHLGGTESNFARMMTNRALQLGMSNTTFTNASGLHNPRQYSSARDMATLARVVINQHAPYYRYFSKANFTYQGHSYHNHNRLMETYKGMDGMKTGYVGASGFNLVASAVRNDRRLIGVVFGGKSAASRNAHMASLLDSGFGRRVDDVRIASVSTNPPPVPARKPALLVALNTLNKAVPAQSVKLASMGPVLDPVKFGELVGEGDLDPAESRRIETGLVAVSAIKGKEARAAAPRTLSAPAADDSWAIQIGAYSSRAATDQALHTAARKLPAGIGGGNPVIAPLKVKEGWMFRARLAGYTRAQAFKACTYIKDCMPVAPQNN